MTWQLFTILQIAGLALISIGLVMLSRWIVLQVMGGETTGG
mgnify:CR=1 FL=1